MDRKYGAPDQDDGSEPSVPKDSGEASSEKAMQGPVSFPPRPEWLIKWFSGLWSGGSDKGPKEKDGVRTSSMRVTKLTRKIPVKVPMEPGPSCEWFLLKFSGCFSIQYCGANDSKDLLDPQISGKRLREIPHDNR
jgi:hypothetical protein